MRCASSSWCATKVRYYLVCKRTPGRIRFDSALLYTLEGLRASGRNRTANLTFTTGCIDRPDVLLGAADTSRANYPPP
jgi:hypothetical protein